jgi:hypothetical protein
MHEKVQLRLDVASVPALPADRPGYATHGSRNSNSRPGEGGMLPSSR